MCSVGISKISGTIHLLWFDFPEQFHCYLHILFSHWFFLNGTCFVKRKVLEMDVLITDAYIMTGSTCFAPTDQSFDGTYGRRINLIGLFTSKKFSRIGKDLTRLVSIYTSYFFKAYGKIQESCHEFIGHSNISTGLVSYVHIVSLVV